MPAQLIGGRYDGMDFQHILGPLGVTEPERAPGAVYLGWPKDPGQTTVGSGVPFVVKPVHDPFDKTLHQMEVYLLFRNGNYYTPKTLPKPVG